MNATKEDLNKLGEKLHAKIENRDSENAKSWNELKEQFHGLNLNLTKMLTKYDGQEDTNIRLSKSLESLHEWKESISKDMAIIQTEQKQTKSTMARFTDKLLIPLLVIFIAALSAVDYWK